MTAGAQETIDIILVSEEASGQSEEEQDSFTSCVVLGGDILIRSGKTFTFLFMMK